MLEPECKQPSCLRNWASRAKLGSLSNSAIGAQKPLGPCPSHSALHEHFPVIPEPIREYIEEVKAQLEEVTLSPGGRHLLARLSCSLARLSSGVHAC